MWREGPETLPTWQLTLSLVGERGWGGGRGGLCLETHTHADIGKLRKYEWKNIHIKYYEQHILEKKTTLNKAQEVKACIHQSLAGSYLYCNL